MAFFNKRFVGVGTMKTQLLAAVSLAGTLLATCLVSGSAHATAMPLLKGPADPGVVTLVGRKGGGGGGGMSRGGGGMKGFSRGGGGGMKGFSRGGGAGRYAYRGDGGGKRYYGGGDRRHYAHKGDHHDGHFRRYSHYGWYGAPFLAYGYYGGGCGWLYRNAVATGDPYWWNRYYACTGYY
jgi:hypothetical protein